jgi:hypothetical protein
MPKYGDIVQVKLTEYGVIENLYFKTEIDGKWYCSQWEDMTNCLPYIPVNAP